jgi:hypothetical protein
MTRRHLTMMTPSRGHAITETIVALLALSPFLFGIPLLGKQLDVKQKTFDAARYSVWERTVWLSDGTTNRKSADDIEVEARDRVLGDPHQGVETVADLRTKGVTENFLWRDRSSQRLLNYDEDQNAPIGIESIRTREPTKVGYWLVPALAYGDGVLTNVGSILQLDDLHLNKEAYASVSVSVALRPLLPEQAHRSPTLASVKARDGKEEPLVQKAQGAILSDTWSSKDEHQFAGRVDDLTINESLADLEIAGRVIGLNALGKGQLLYGEGQYGWDPDLKPKSTTLPKAYVVTQKR